PKISIVVPTYETPKGYLRAMLRSVQAQTYRNWELCIADGASQSSWVRDILSDFRNQDTRIKVTFLERNAGIAGNTQAALDMATGEYVAFLDHDDTLAPFAMYEVVKALDCDSDIDILYSDEDKIGAAGSRRRDPTFKPAWSPDLLRSR